MNDFVCSWLLILDDSSVLISTVSSQKKMFLENIEVMTAPEFVEIGAITT